MELRVILILTVLSYRQCREVHLSCKKVHEFVDGHNARRGLLAQGKVAGQPAASKMNKLVWDDELQDKATKWAKRHERQDVRSHNPSKTIPSGRFTTSENLYWYSTTDPQYKLHPENVLDAWFSEHKNYTFRPLSARDFTSGPPEIGHYTQMVWSDSIYVGCAISKKVKRAWHNFFVVCNYGPQGNFLGHRPYPTKGGASGRLTCKHNDCRHPYGKRC